MIKDKYLRYALGIPVFCLGIGFWIVDGPEGAKWWQIVLSIFDGIVLTYIGLKLLDVPSVTIIHNIDKTHD